ncbi:hypothetical protein ACFL0S_03240 [Thermodesulfobacteriota bacterium]
MGDWLINYQGGFIRRGLLGELIYQLSLLSNINSGLLLLILQILLYSIFFIFSYLLIIKQSSISSYILLIFSPFIFSFQVNDFYGGFRKEVIFFALLSFMAWLPTVSSKRNFEITFFVALFIYPIFIFSHEQLAILLPYLLIIYLHNICLTKLRTILIISLSSLSVIAFLVCCYHSGSASQVEIIQNSLITTGYQVESGAITWLGHTVKDNIINAHFYIIEHNYFTYYSIILLLSIVAYVPISGKIYIISKIQYSKMLLLVSLLGTVTLLYATCDWGRLLYIHLVSIFILSLNINDYNTSNLNSLIVNFFDPKVNILRAAKKYLAVVLIFLYSFTWYIPHYKPDFIYEIFPKTTIGRIILPYIIIFHKLSKN